MLLDDEEKRFPSACAESKAGRVRLFAARTAEYDLSILPQPVVLSGSTRYGHRILVRPFVIVASWTLSHRRSSPNMIAELIEFLVSAPRIQLPK